MRLRPRSARFKVMPEAAAPRPRGLRVAAVSFWLLVALLAVLLLFHLGRSWLFVRLEGRVHLSGYGLFSEHPLVLQKLRVREGERITAGRVVAEVAPPADRMDGETEALRQRLRQVRQARRLVEAGNWRRLKQSPELLALLPESYIRGQALAAAQIEKLFELAPVKPPVRWWREAALARLARELARIEDDLRQRRAADYLTAPHSGTVTHIFKHPGDEVRPGELILRVHTEGCEIQVPVPWSHLTTLSERRRVHLLLPDGRRWEAEVVRWLAAAAPYDDRPAMKRYFTGGVQHWRFVLRPSAPDFPCLEYDRGVVAVEFPRWPLSEWTSALRWLPFPSL